MKTTTLSDQALAAQTAKENREKITLISKLMDSSQSMDVRTFNSNQSLELDF